MVQSSAERYQHSPTAAGHVYLYLTTNGFLISAFPEYSCLAFSTPCNIVPQFQFLAVSTPAFWDILVLFPFPLFHVSHFQRPHLAVSCAGTVYIYFLGLLSPWQNFTRCKVHFTSKSCVLLWQRYCTTLVQRASSKLCGVVLGMELPYFRRGRHIYSAGRPARWASAHILVYIILTRFFTIRPTLNSYLHLRYIPLNYLIA